MEQSCHRLLSTSTVRQAPFGCRCSSGTVPFLYVIIFYICSVSPVWPFLLLLFASGLRSEKRLLFPLSHPCCFDLLFTHRVTNLTHSLGLGLRVFCPVLPVSLPFSGGSVPTLFDFTIYFHFNLFKSLMKVQSSRFQRSPFSLGTGLKIRCMYFL